MPTHLDTRQDEDGTATYCDACGTWQYGPDYCRHLHAWYYRFEDGGVALAHALALGKAGMGATLTTRRIGVSADGWRGPFHSDGDAFDAATNDTSHTAIK